MTPKTMVHIVLATGALLIAGACADHDDGAYVTESRYTTTTPGYTAAPAPAYVAPAPNSSYTYTRREYRRSETDD